MKCVDNIRSGTAPEFWTFSCKIRESTTDYPSESVVRGEEMVESLAQIPQGEFFDGNCQCRRGITNKKLMVGRVKLKNCEKERLSKLPMKFIAMKCFF